MNIWMIRKNSAKHSYLKKKIYIHLNMEDITDAIYVHTKRVCKDLEIKILGEYHDLCVRSYTLLLHDVIGNFGNVCLNVYKLNTAKSFSAPGLA